MRQPGVKHKDVWVYVMSTELHYERQGQPRDCPAIKAVRGSTWHVSHSRADRLCCVHFFCLCHLLVIFLYIHLWKFYKKCYIFMRPTYIQRHGVTMYVREGNRNLWTCWLVWIILNQYWGRWPTSLNYHFCPNFVDCLDVDGVHVLLFFVCFICLSACPELAP